MAGEIRVTSQIVEAASSGGTARITSQIVEGVISGGDVRVTSQIVEVVFPFLSVQVLEAALTGSGVVVAGMLNPKQLIAGITGSALVAPNLTEETFLAGAIVGSGVVTANITLPGLSVALTGSATVVAGTSETTQFTLFGGITATATVTALFDKNLEPASSAISFTQSATLFNQSPGNTLFLTQTASVGTELSPESSVLAGLTSVATFVAVFNRSLTSVLDALDHTIIPIAVLPTEATSSTLSFTSVASAFNQVPSNTLVLTDTAVGVIGGILESASNTLSFTSVATTALVLIPSLTDTLFLTQNAVAEHISDHSASNTLSFKDLAFGALVEEKCFVILQAPFNFLQTSMVLPCPIFGDTENIVSEVSLRRSMNGKTQTHVKTNDNRRLNYTFRILDRQKAVEVSEFFKFYNSDLIRLTNWKGEVWKVNLLTNPIDFVKTGRFNTDVSLEFEGELING